LREIAVTPLSACLRKSIAGICRRLQHIGADSALLFWPHGQLHSSLDGNRIINIIQPR
jgi:hypothetical protein